jgi:hypothetical protein
MLRSDFPRLGSARPYPVRNQFGRSRRSPVIGCACCDAFAVCHVVVQRSLFRGEDLNVYLCEAHAALARREQWRTLFELMANG